MAWPYDSGGEVPPNAKAADLYSEPDSITAGDSLHWRRSLPDYKASGGWSLTYYLVGGPATAELTSTAYGDDHDVVVTKDTTAGWVKGTYRLLGFAVSATERHQIYDHALEVAANPATMQGGQDMRSHARRTLDLLEAVIEGRATDDVLNSSIEGTTISRLTPQELLRIATYYRSMVKSEEIKANAQKGRASGKIILAKFVAPS